MTGNFIWATLQAQAQIKTQTAGIRSIHFDKNLGFFLNGKSTKIKGVCVHDDAGSLGVAVPKEVWSRRLCLLKEAGVNALRFSHIPHADYLYELCDKLGFLVMDEAFDEWEIGKNKWVKGWNLGTPSKDGYHEYFEEWAVRDLGDMILRDRNHPSIIMWSIGNEIDYPNHPYSNLILNTGRNPQIYWKGYLPAHPKAESLTIISKRLVKTVKDIDTTHFVTAALAGVVMSNEVGYPETLDIVGYNYQEYRYTQDHRRYPERVIYGSENGMNRQAWTSVDSNTYISAQFLWTGIDYMGEAGKWPQRSNDAGLVDMAGFKKPEFYYRQSFWDTKPMTYLVCSQIGSGNQIGKGPDSFQPSWNWPNSSKIKVENFTNCEETELFLNGKSLGRKAKSSSKNQVPTWDVDYQPGILLVKGYNLGKEVSNYSLKTAGDATEIRLISDEKSFKSKIKGLCQLEIQLVDKNGNLSYASSSELQVQVNRPARLLGLESGSLDSHEKSNSTKRKALHGRLLAYVQTTGTSGKVEIKVSGSNLKTAVESFIINE